MIEASLPSPGEYDDWKSWASMLVSALQNTDSGVVNLGLWVWDDTKERNGLPPAMDGDQIRVKKDGKIYLGVYDENSGWILYSPQG
jgi:hypothetical protein